MRGVMILGLLLVCACSRACDGDGERSSRLPWKRDGDPGVNAAAPYPHLNKTNFPPIPGRVYPTLGPQARQGLEGGLGPRVPIDGAGPARP